MYRLFVLIGVFSLLFLSCKKEVLSQSEIDEGVITKYIADNNLEAIRHESGLYYIITKVGAGKNPTYTSYVKVNYAGVLTNGTEFDSGTLNYYSLQNLIHGWQIGIPLLKAGGEGKFIIPSGLGYGRYAKGNIPANSVLIFDISLIDFRY